MTPWRQRTLSSSFLLDHWFKYQWLPYHWFPHHWFLYHWFPYHWLPYHLKPNASLLSLAVDITIRMCASRHASRRPNTRSHPPMKRARSDRRAVSFSGGSYLSQDNGYAAWAKLWCLSRQWQRKTTRATSLGDARFAGKNVSEVPRMIFAKIACDAMWTTSTKAALSQTRRSSHTPGQGRYKAQ